MRRPRRVTTTSPPPSTRSQILAEAIVQLTNADFAL